MYLFTVSVMSLFLTSSLTYAFFRLTVDQICCQQFRSVCSTFLNIEVCEVREIVNNIWNKRFTSPAPA